MKNIINREFNQYDLLSALITYSNTGFLKITVNDDNIDSFKVDLVDDIIYFKIGVDYDDEVEEKKQDKECDGCVNENQLKNMKSLLKKCETFIAELEKS